MASGGLRPLDGAFVARLRSSLNSASASAAQLSAEARQHWQSLLDHFSGRSDFEVAAYIAQNFRNDVWQGTEAWFTHPVIQQVFAGYDRTTFDQLDLPPLDDVARSHYHPSTTVREYLPGSS
jgi:hypothetical protein